MFEGFRGKKNNCKLNIVFSGASQAKYHGIYNVVRRWWQES
jgi:hypothetical protein